MHLEGVARAGVVVAIAMFVMVVEAVEVAEDTEVVQVNEGQVGCSILCTRSLV